MHSFFKITNKEYTLLSIVVDDLLICSNKEHFINDLLKVLKSRFRVKDLGKPKYIIGARIKY